MAHKSQEKYTPPLEPYSGPAESHSMTEFPNTSTVSWNISLGTLVQ